MQIKHGCFKSEEHGGMITQSVGHKFSLSLHPVAYRPQHIGIVRKVITTQPWEWCALSHSDGLWMFSVGSRYKPRASGGVNTSGGASRLLEMEGSLVDGEFEHVVESDLWQFGIFLEVRLALFEECFSALLRLIEEIIQHGTVAGELLDASLSVKFRIETSLDHP